MNIEFLYNELDKCIERCNKLEKECAEWWVLAIITNTQDVKILASWLPDFDEKKYYKKAKQCKMKRVWKQ